MMKICTRLFQALVLAACSGSLLQAATPVLWVDCHTHFYDPTRPQGVPWPSKGTALYRPVLPKDLRAQPMAQGLAGTVIVEASAWTEDNQWLLDLAKDDPFVLGLIGHLEPEDPSFAQHLRRFARDPRFRGIRVSATAVEKALRSGRLEPYHLLAGFDLALDVNGGPQTPALVAQLAALLPHLRIVINHVGNVPVTKAGPAQEWVAGMRAAAAQPAVFCKVSGLVESAANQAKAAAPRDAALYQPYLEVVWQCFGAKRLIYGSNWPVSERGADYAWLQQLVIDFFQGKGERALRAFASQNSVSAYHWQPRLPSQDPLAQAR